MDVTFLDAVFSAPGPYATVCADVTHDTETADTELELGVGAITEELIDAHLVPAELAMLRAAVGSSAAVVVVPRSAVPGDVPVAAVLRCTDDSTPS